MMAQIYDVVCLSAEDVVDDGAFFSINTELSA
jgi:hypothetical protein